ncbi:LysE family transporter [Flavobacterium sp.]|uniref:LysE family transporter n=1 Tax=Flavobacterium sp. TaxID=239 RepID=UPI00260768BD|nr:LysE family transporter [Flavobacterium sp.]MDG2432013.1 hypothetical protein [Flavobacterium sp.]
MKLLKNSIVGFIVSFVGSMPLGYLNIVGFETYNSLGLESLLLYLLGVVIIEAVVIYCTLIFARTLVQNTKLMKVIDVLGIFFLLFLAYSFYAHSQKSTIEKGYINAYIAYSPFLMGVLLSSLNFLQLPFWTAWNLYLLNNNYIRVANLRLKMCYLVGTIVGTFSGMIAFVTILQAISKNTTGLTSYLMPVVVPSIFVLLALFQLYKVVKKYLLT